MKENKLVQYFKDRSEHKEPQDSPRYVQSIKHKLIMCTGIIVIPAIAIIGGNKLCSTVEKSYESENAIVSTNMDPVVLTSIREKIKINPGISLEALDHQEIIPEIIQELIEIDPEYTDALEIVVDAAVIITPDTSENIKTLEEINAEQLEIHNATFSNEPEPEKIKKLPPAVIQTVITKSKGAVDKIAELEDNKIVKGTVNLSKKGYAGVKTVGSNIAQSDICQGTAQIGKGIVNLGSAGVDKTTDALAAGKNKLQSWFKRNKTKEI
jgi:hypothetical protein